MSCIFCDMKDCILENDLAYAIFDEFLVNKGKNIIEKLNKLLPNEKLGRVIS